jgi:heat shock protein HspQ
MNKIRNAKYQLGQVLRHRLYPFRGVVFDIDPVFANTDEWYEAIPADVRPHKDQPFYHLFAENDETEYVAYVSEQNLLPDESGEPLRHRSFRDRRQRWLSSSHGYAALSCVAAADSRTAANVSEKKTRRDCRASLVRFCTSDRLERNRFKLNRLRL